MMIPNFEDAPRVVDEAELEMVAEYLEGRMSYADEQAFGSRMVTDHAFRQRLRPIIRACYTGEVLPIEIEAGMRLAERGIIPRSTLEPRPQRPVWRRRGERKRRPAP